MAVSRTNRHNAGGRNNLHAAPFMHFMPPHHRTLPKTGPHRSYNPLPGRRRGRSGRSRY
jgi:hypothetical protein